MTPQEDIARRSVQPDRATIDRLLSIAAAIQTVIAPVDLQLRKKP